MKTLILIISLTFNIVLYFGIIDLGQYRNYINKGITFGKDIINNPKVQDLKKMAPNAIDNSISGTATGVKIK